jgi:hypothetical protein
MNDINIGRDKSNLLSRSRCCRTLNQEPQAARLAMVVDVGMRAILLGDRASIGLVL